MIVRILGEGQYELPDDSLPSLEVLDAGLNAALEAGDDAGFELALQALVDKVRGSGRPLELTTIVPSDLTVPHAGATIEDLRKLLASEPEDSQAVTEGA
ncbi:MAG: PspA-associated protein PspAA [Acidimicrobiales bacterium]|jgi:hypothetical protein